MRSLERIGIESGIELPPLIPAATTVLDPRKDSERGLQQWREAWWWVSVDKRDPTVIPLSTFYVKKAEYPVVE